MLQAVPDFDVDVRFDIEREELLKIIPEYDAIVVRSVTKINEEFYKHATNLKVVGRAGNGVDKLRWKGRLNAVLSLSIPRNLISYRLPSILSVCC